VLGLGRLADLLVQLRLNSTRMYNPAITFRNPWGERRFGPGGDLHGIAFKSNPSGCSTQMLEATARGRNIRRVDVKRGGAVVASFFLAVFGHPGRKGRAATDADIEVPAQLLRDLFDAVTHMDALAIDADAL